MRGKSNISSDGCGEFPPKIMKQRFTKPVFSCSLRVLFWGWRDEVQLRGFHTKRWLSLIYLLLTLLIGMQFFALTQHHHNMGIDSDHCAACDLVHHFSTGGKPLSPSLALLSLILIWWAIRLPIVTNLYSRRAYLRPGSQAPPQS